MQNKLTKRVFFLALLAILLLALAACATIGGNRNRSGISAGDHFGVLYSLDGVPQADSVTLTALEKIDAPFTEAKGALLYFYQYDAEMNKTRLDVYDTETDRLLCNFEKTGKIDYMAFDNNCYALCEADTCTLYDRAGKTIVLDCAIADLSDTLHVNADILTVAGEGISYRLTDEDTYDGPFTLSLPAKASYTYITDNYYYIFTENSVTVYDDYLMPAYYYEIPSEAANGRVFYLTNDTVAVQYSYALPISEVDYDYMEGNIKYRLYTDLIPVLTGEPKKLDVNYLFERITPLDGAQESAVAYFTEHGIRTNAMAAIATAREIVDAHLSDEKTYAINASLGMIENLNGFFNVPTNIPVAVTSTYFQTDVPLFDCVYFLDKQGRAFLTLPKSDTVFACTPSYIVTADTVYAAGNGSVLYRLSDLDKEAGMTFYAAVLDRLYYRTSAGDIYRFACPDTPDKNGVREGTLAERVIKADTYAYAFGNAAYGYYMVRADGGTGVCRYYDGEGALLLESPQPLMYLTGNENCILFSRTLTDGTSQDYLLKTHESADN